MIARFSYIPERYLEAKTRMDTFLQWNFHVEPATKSEGIDCLLIDVDGNRYSCLYVADYKAHRSMYGYLETLTMNGTNKSNGWLFHSQADLLLYYVVHRGWFILCSLERLQTEYRKHFRHMYRKSYADMFEGRSYGIDIPLYELERVAWLKHKENIF